MAGLLLTIAIAVLFSALWNWRIDSIATAAVLTAICTPTVFTIIQVVYEGYLDPFFIVSFSVVGVLSMVVSLIIGGCFAWWRSKRQRKADLT